jgi:hypothetical protein
VSYADDRLTAADMLAEDGQTVTLAYVGTSVYDPATGETTITAPDPQTVSGAIFPLSPFAKQGNSNIVAGDQQLLLAGQNTAGTAITAPQVSGTVTDANGAPWTLIAVEPLSPAGTDVLYDCVVRRAA